MQLARAQKKNSWLADLFKSKHIASVYSLLADHSLWADQNQQLMQHFGIEMPPDPQILDLGSGTGIGTQALAESLQGRGHVYGLDFSSEMITIANQSRKHLPNVSYQCGDATDLNEFDDNSIDYVVANSFLYLVPQRELVLQEVRRVLRNGGRVVFMEPREEGSIALATLHALRNVGTAVRRPVSALRLGASMIAWRTLSTIEGRMTIPETAALFEEAGFTSVEFVPTLGGIGHYVVAR